MTVLCLTGGIGGAKLAVGLQAVMPPEQLIFTVNGGDDFVHLGFEIWPDFDTLVYTLSGLANAELGWGRSDERWTFHETLRDLGGPDWFRLGDRDLALHAWRTEALRSGASRTDVADRIAGSFGVRSPVLPANSAATATWIESDEGRLAFQDYFVRRQAAPKVRSIDYVIETGSELNAEIAAMLADTDLAAIVIAPSNPWLSIAPILATPGCKPALAAASAPVVAVSPIIGGRAVKGPTAKIMKELGFEVSSVSIARFYDGIIDGLVIDEADASSAPAIEAMGIRCQVAPTLMRDAADKRALAQTVLTFAHALRDEAAAG